MQKHAPAYGLPDPKPAFGKDPDPSGTARVTPEVVLIKLSYNIIEMLLPLFRDRDEVLVQYISDDISLVNTTSNMSMAEQLVHYTAMAQYYHEFAHLIQDKDQASRTPAELTLWLSYYPLVAADQFGF